MHFDAALRACDRQARWQEALRLFERLRESGLRPTTRSFECTIRAVAKGGQHQLVDMIWQVLVSTRECSFGSLGSYPALLAMLYCLCRLRLSPPLFLP